MVLVNHPVSWGAGGARDSLPIRGSLVETKIHILK